MNSEVLKQILNEFERRRDRALHEQKMRQEKVYLKVPEIKEIDAQISKTGFLIAKAVLNNPENYMEYIEKIQKDMEQLKMKKAVLLTENNITLEYLDVNFQCNVCKDTGYLPDGQMCNCLKQELINKAYKMSNLENVLKKENFRTFKIDIFPDKPFNGEKLTPRENMMNILSISEGFVNNFDNNNGDNLLFYGTTGLGKTFLCNCIAKALLDKNKIVIYQTAFKILETIEDHRFRRGESQFNNEDYNLLFDADLLIIDDLGTEVTNTFTNAETFNIVNTRIIKGKKTIISTNLTPKQITETYSDRIFSRVYEKFIPLKFYGPDLRWEL
jgi:DNA replication protein DnaC